MVNNRGVIIHKTKHKKGHRHDYDIYKKNHPVTPKDVVMFLISDILELRKTFQTNIVLTKQKEEEPKRVV